MWARAAAFLRSDRGATAIEYALIVGGIAVAIAVVVATLGTTLADFFASLLVAIAG